MFFKKKPEMVITAVNSITSVGHDAYMTAGAVYSDIAMLHESDEFFDGRKPVIVSKIQEISEKEVEDEFMYEVAEKCFNDLINSYFNDNSVHEIHTYLCIPHDDNPDEKLPYQWEAHRKMYMDRLLNKSDKVSFSAFYCGNPGTFFALKKAEAVLEKNPDVKFIIGSVDSLLNFNIIESLIDDRRVKSVNYGLNHGLVPSHGAGFMVVESKESALKRDKEILAEIKGIGVSEEPCPITSGEPTRFSGLTEAIKKNLKENKLDIGNIKTVFSDLNGEYFRSKEWSFAEIRCFKKTKHELIHPADCFGAIGAASGSVLTNLASVYISEKWIEDNAMVVCSDDYGYCGSLVLGKYEEKKE